MWALLGAAGLLAHSQIGDVTAAGQTSFLPADAESTRALDALQSGQGSGGEEVPAVVVFYRPGGLTGADLDAIGQVGDGLDRLGITGATPAIDPFGADAREPLGEVAKIARGVGPLSRDEEAALVVLALDSGDRGAVVDGVQEIRAYLAAHRIPGVSAYVTGPAGIAADLDKVAADAGRTLLVATLGLVLVLLLIVYRAPILALTPLLAVAAAYLVAIGIAYLTIEAGWITVNTEGTLLLLVLVFGAGTDYSLLLVHRYREQLARGRPPDAALPLALRESIPAIGASGGTVIAAMLVLLVADLESTHWLGPILAIGIAVMLAAAFTLLPALLAILGGRAFWPARPAAPPRGEGHWARMAALVRRRSGAIVLLVSVGLVVLALGNLAHHGTIGFGQGQTDPSNSSRGTAVLEAHFPPGIGSPLTAVVPISEAEAVAVGMRDLDAIQLALPAPVSSDLATVVLVLRGDPYSDEAADAVKDIRERLHELAPSALLGGIPAENYDVEQTNSRDTKLIVPLVLVVVGLILIALLRALLAPAVLILTVLASFAATLGLATFAFSVLFGADGLAFNLVLMAFIFLVALGVDSQLSFTYEGWTAMYDTYIPLLTFRHANGRAGADVIPGLARSLPRISNGGKTYTLFLRTGLKYSDGSPVKASDFEYAIRRLFRLHSGATVFYNVIAGTRRLQRTGRGGISGIVADNQSGKIVIHLTRPSSNFQYLLAMPFAALVPAGTPMRDLTDAPPAATGPYVISGIRPGLGWSYARNPEWQANNGSLLPQLPGGYVDAIEVHVVRNGQAQVRGVLSGRFDWMQNPPPTDRLAELRRRFGGKQFRFEPTLSTYYFWMNVRKPPFNDLRVRRAANYAVNPAVLKRIYGGRLTPSQGVLPRGMPGYRKLALYPYNLAKARGLVAAADPMDRDVTVWADDEAPNLEAAAYYRRQLQRIGLRAHLKVLNSGSYFSVIGNRATPDLDTGWANWYADYPHPDDFFRSMLLGSSIHRFNNGNFSQINVPSLNARIERLSRERPGRALERRYAALDRSYMKLAPWVPYGNITLATLVAKDVDLKRVVWNPIVGADLASFQLRRFRALSSRR